MAIQCQYDLEAHLGHIITFLLHPGKFNLCCSGNIFIWTESIMAQSYDNAINRGVPLGHIGTG